MLTIIRALRVNGLVVKGRVKEGGRRLSKEGDLITFLFQRRGLSEKGRLGKGLTIPLLLQFSLLGDISLIDYKHNNNNNTVTKRYNKPWIQME